MTGTRVRPLLLTAALATAFGCPTLVRADGEIPGLLLQGGIVVPKTPIVVDPKLPKGPPLRWSERPKTKDRSCASLEPVCVHGGTLAQRQSALSTFRHAFVQWAYVKNRPAPLGDLTQGGGPELDVYLTKQALPLVVERDAPRLSSDQSSGFCLLDVRNLDVHWLTLCVAELSSLALDAASGDGMRRAWSQQQIEHLVEPEPATLSAIDRAQANPQAPLLTRDRSPLSDASWLFWSYMDANLGALAHGDLALTLLTLARRQEPRLEAHPEWDNAPDELDVLRRAFNDDPGRMATQLVNFAVWRAFLGSRSDAAHRPLMPALGELGRIRFDWVFPYSSLPRHVAGPYPIYPLGSAYLWLDLDDVPLNAELGFRAEWEQPVQFQWSIVRVDAEGRMMSQQNLPFLERATSVEKTLLNFQGAAGLLIVGINLGAVDTSHPFDPDQEPWEPHGYSVYLTTLGQE